MSRLNFADAEVTAVNFKPEWHKERKVTSSKSQTDKLKTKDFECQARQTENVRVQTEKTKVESSDVVDVDYAILSKFLSRIEPKVIEILDQNIRNRSSTTVASLWGQENDVKNTFTLKHKDIEPELQCLKVDWNSSGTTVAVAYGQLFHEDWCVHRGTVCTWNIERRAIDAAKADVAIDMDSCVTAIQYHSVNPALLAIGTFRGEVAIANYTYDDGQMITSSSTSTQNDDNTEVTKAETGHNEPITSLVWLSTDASDPKLLSAGFDGKLFMWQLPARGTQLQIVKSFVMIIASLPRTLRGKATALDRETGIVSVCFSRTGITEKYMAGTETGGVFQCSLDSKDPISSYVTTSDVPVYSPVSLTMLPHKGPVFSLDSSPFYSNLFLSCSADGSIVGHSLIKSESLFNIDLSSGYINTCSWSSSRPSVFACGCGDGRVAIFDLSQSQNKASFWLDSLTTEKGSSSDSCAIQCVKFNSQRGDLIACGDGNGIIRIWSLGDRFNYIYASEQTFMQQFVSNLE